MQQGVVKKVEREDGTVVYCSEQAQQELVNQGAITVVPGAIAPADAKEKLSTTRIQNPHIAATDAAIALCQDLRLNPVGCFSKQDQLAMPDSLQALRAQAKKGEIKKSKDAAMDGSNYVDYKQFFKPDAWPYQMRELGFVRNQAHLGVELWVCADSQRNLRFPNKIKVASILHR